MGETAPSGEVRDCKLPIRELREGETQVRGYPERPSLEHFLGVLFGLQHTVSACHVASRILLGLVLGGHFSGVF